MSNQYAHAQLRRVVSGAVEDAFKMHPDYLTPKGRHSAKESVVKRVSGTVLSFAVQAAKGQRELALKADQPNQVDPQVSPREGGDAGAGDFLSSAPLDPHCRLGKVRSKLRSRYRGAQAFDLTASRLLRIAIHLTPEQREAAKNRALSKVSTPLTDKQREQGSRS